jgi:translocation and assembly module TamB
MEGHLIAPQGGVLSRLAHLKAPLTADLGGRGDWRAWDGRAVAVLGGRPLLDASLTARSGLFSVRGQALPESILTGPAAALTSPALGFDLSGRLRKRQLDVSAGLASAAFIVTGGGRLDLANGRYQGVRVAARLVKPGAAAPQLNGRDIVAALALDGPFARPLVDYDVRAARIGFAAMVIDDFHANGRASIDAAGALRLPVHATARRMIGAPAAVGGLANNLRVDGDFVVTPRQIASDNLRLRSDRLQATAIVALSLQTGRYDGALKGAINRYAVPGLGVVDVVTNARLIPTGRGEFRIAGHVSGRTLRLDNPSAAKFLGGNAQVAADFTRSPDGVFGIANLRLRAPRFRVVSGGGTYAANGRIAFTANAVSADYGPARLDVAGALAAPQIRLRAPNPRVG